LSDAGRVQLRSTCRARGRGLAYRAKGDNDRAIADYNEAIRLDPRLAQAY
jgi:tetratricopeptide (TPR) repeat protein